MLPALTTVELDFELCQSYILAGYRQQTRRLFSVEQTRRHIGTLRFVFVCYCLHTRSGCGTSEDISLCVRPTAAEANKLCLRITAHWSSSPSTHVAGSTSAFRTPTPENMMYERKENMMYECKKHIMYECKENIMYE